MVVRKSQVLGRLLIRSNSSMGKGKKLHFVRRAPNLVYFMSVPIVDFLEGEPSETNPQNKMAAGFSKMAAIKSKVSD